MTIAKSLKKSSISYLTVCFIFYFILLLCRWDHSVEWDVAKFAGSSAKSEFNVNVDLNDPSMAYLEGHTIDGRVLFPATGYMVRIKCTAPEISNLQN